MRGMIYMLTGTGRAILRVDFDYSDNNALELFRYEIQGMAMGYSLPTNGIEITSTEQWPLRPLKT